jgi:phenylacetaldehyde dehydrogenase
MAQSSTMPSVAPEVQAFVSTTRRMLIDGSWVEAASGKAFPVYDPAIEAIIAHVAEGEAEDIDRAVRAARRAFDAGPWRKVMPSERGRMLWRLGDLLESHAEEFAQLESLDNGKPLTIARIADGPLAVDMFRYMAGWATKIEGHMIPISALWPRPYGPGRCGSIVTTSSMRPCRSAATSNPAGGAKWAIMSWSFIAR